MSPTRTDTDQVFDGHGNVVSSTPVVRDVTVETNLGSLQTLAQQALANNATFLALGSPTNAQTLAQVQLLTRECSALIRIAFNLLSSTAGT